MYGYLSIMRAVIQRVSQASVMIENHKTQSISKGAVILLGIGVHDTSEDVITLANKILISGRYMLNWNAEKYSSGVTSSYP